MKIIHVLSAALLPLTLGGCALAPPGKTEAPVAPQWQAPLPHNGSLTDLSSWWRQQGDPLLGQLVEAAQTASPNVATARSRIAQSRADRIAAGAALAPTLDASMSVSRANQQSTLPGGTSSQAGLESAWEIDLFGGARATRNASEERLAGARASWHDARVTVAAEVANQYYSLRACEQLLAVARLDAASREDTARLTGLSADAGFQAPATAALARASAAEGKSRATLQRALCDIDVKTLVALTAIDEADLRARLLAGTPVTPPPLGIAALPAQVLAQRPDVFTAEREVAAASFDVGSAQAQRYPRLTLRGAIGAANFRSGGDNTQLDTWSIGPLALTLPIFDGGRRSANVDAAKARYEAAVVSYRASARRAVSEVEQALVNLNSAADRSADAQVSLDGYRAAFRAAEDRYKNGLGSLLELEDARRTRLAAENAVVTLERERSAATVALYRAAGGGWTTASN
ncbi:efflux transporter outer membrane subunit [Massilia antarctica]|uniref:efflux transporter outer membrane subunit n=1 Tax=Massilia antarctica TaxID=2765360 RepID=UPI0006BB8025|nr:efflux transporter outer membrane subunit [Massilia sp. H27-R4]MCY0911144.1 efflux transporter outer membrane subunit [Massilia sp. H27-R4]CUI05271.1 RND efflux system, outer membrane lipoprotein, NodT family [Janthinobacterium sp. CG23_2]CUU29057.1 RND efflux system, outer membrane lipoprotein, NodT family [Janthinobacterium sp. CG23_2]